MTKEISFEDIRKGDRIRVTRAHPEINGRVETRIFEGVAHHRDLFRDWVTEEDALLTYNSSIAEQTYELIERPKPPLPTTPGTVFRATEIRGEACDVAVFVRLGVMTPLVYVSADPISGHFDLHPTHITEWEPIE